MFRPAPSVGLGRRWHIVDRKLNGFMLVAPYPCGFIQAEILCERVNTSQERLLTGDAASSSAERAVCALRPCASIRPPRLRYAGVAILVHAKGEPVRADRPGGPRSLCEGPP
jgi:hypothetical protein